MTIRLLLSLANVVPLKKKKCSIAMMQIRQLTKIRSPSQQHTCEQCKHAHNSLARSPAGALPHCTAIHTGNGNGGRYNSPIDNNDNNNHTSEPSGQFSFAIVAGRMRASEQASYALSCSLVRSPAGCTCASGDQRAALAVVRRSYTRSYCHSYAHPFG